MNTKAFLRFLGLSGLVGQAEANANDTTVGAATLSAAALVGGVITRSGSTADYTDTTPTATAIIDALPIPAVIGQSWELLIKNTVAFAETLAAGTGVTLAGQIIVPPLSWMRLLVSYTGAGAVTIRGMATGPLADLPNAKYSTAALSGSTASAGQLTGAKFVVMNNSGANPGTYTTRTATQMFADTPNAQVGQSYVVRLKNGQATGNLTLAGGTGVTATATILPNTWRDFLVTFDTATTMTFQSLGTGTDS